MDTRIDRRRFVGASALAAAGLASAAYGQAEDEAMPRDGVQLYWFSQLAAADGKSLEEMLPEFFGMIAEAEFSAIDGNLNYCATDEAASDLAGKLETAGLGILGLYAGGAFHDENAANDVKTLLAQAALAKEIGCPGITSNPNPIGREKSDTELANQAAALNDVGAGLAELDMFFAVHTHAPEMSHNAREFRYNLEHTDPATVGLCADFHWMYRGGGDPYALTQQYIDRINSTHLRNSIEAIWAESFCAGDIDYGRIRNLLDEAKYDGPLVVELAIEPATPRTRTPLANLKLSRAYLREIFGV